MMGIEAGLVAWALYCLGAAVMAQVAYEQLGRGHTGIVMFCGVCWPALAVAVMVLNMLGWLRS